MLSRVAERVYWMGRYMERIENIARLINVNSNLLLDLPEDSEVSWLSLISIVDGKELAMVEIAKSKAKTKAPAKKKDAFKIEEQVVAKLLISDKSSPCSIISCLFFARENARTAREIIPSEAWELINDLYLFAKENASKSISRTARQTFLSQIIHRIQQYTGMMAGTMSHTSAYDFIRLGRNIERADMTTRIVDVGAINLMRGRKQKSSVKDAIADPFPSILWMSVLQSLSAYQMYRQHVLGKVNGNYVVSFLLQDRDFPRSASSCLENLKLSLNKLPRHDKPLRAVASAQRRLDNLKTEEVIENGQLHEYIDLIQLDISSIHSEIVDTWFLPRVPIDAETSAPEPIAEN